MTSTRHAAWVLLAACVISPAANATLGGDIASVAQDRTLAKAALRAQPSRLYTVFESQNESGTLIREYAGVDGKIFAVAWSGPLMPDLRQLLGPYFPQYIANSGERKSGHSSRNARHGDLVVHSGGRMRAFSGKAYLESAIPKGVEIDGL
ncbi:MAG: DUF2844 domain-containing protein [Pseudomonadota bacterium]